MKIKQNGLKLDRSRVEIKVNQFVNVDNTTYKITQLINFEEVIGINIDTKRAKRLLIKDIKPINPNSINANNIVHSDLNDIDESQYEKAKQRYKDIEPILKKQKNRQEIEEYSKEIGVHFTTLYRWVERYKSTGTLLGLISKTPGQAEGEKRINTYAEHIMREVIESYYLTPQKPSVQSVIYKVFSECKKRDIQAPSKNTIRNRIKDITEYEKLKKQGSRSIARTKYEPAPGKFEADHPLQLIEVDHTPVDIILVDDATRQSIGRPWITVAIDIYSRMIVGYYLSMNAPSVTSVGMCISNSILPKDEILLKHDVNSNWNVWGFPETIHVDNGADFRADAIKNAGLAYGINIEFRPVGRANFGGHIERVIGTLMSAVHNLPGSTFSNIQQRGEYDSDAHASMTFQEFEKWLLTFITKIYHKRTHSSIDMSPEQQWEEGIFGEDSIVGLAPKPTNNISIFIDFLPFFTRTVQKNGVNIDGLNYYDHILRSKIHQYDDKDKKRKKQFIFKRDPRDISYVWFYEDSTQEYFKIPLADQSIPSMTLWEFETIKSKIKEKGTQRINQDAILEAYEELHQQISSSIKKSKKARRENQKLKNKEVEMQDINKSLPTAHFTKEQKNDVRTVEVDNNLWDDDIPEFD